MRLPCKMIGENSHKKEEKNYKQGPS